LDIYSKYEDDLFEYLGTDLALKTEIEKVKNRSQIELQLRQSIPFLVNKMVYQIVTFPRKIAKIFKL
jgi:hypothetical protein